MSTEIVANILDFLAGFAGRSPTRLAMVKQYSHWRRMAALELDSRAARFLEVLPEPELRAIATGKVDLAALANKLQARP